MEKKDDSKKMRSITIKGSLLGKFSALDTDSILRWCLAEGNLFPLEKAIQQLGFAPTRLKDLYDLSDKYAKAWQNQKICQLLDALNNVSFVLT